MRHTQMSPPRSAPPRISSTRASSEVRSGGADAYERHDGRYSASLAAQMVRLATISPGQRALDVGCGPGALTSTLATAVGPENVAAVDSHEPFVKACRDRVPHADVRVAAAERLPCGDGHFDVALAQLVLDYVEEPERAVAQMRRVVRPGGVIAACVWDYPGEMTMLRVFWDAASALDPLAAKAHDQGRAMRFCQRGELGQLWRSAGLERVEEGELLASARYADFDAFWDPFEAGVAPGGPYCKSLGANPRGALREECFRRLGSPAGPFYLSARAWSVRGRN
jgi:ubiquinone/menaquinone biosynthesis C-methylase UbiE